MRARTSFGAVLLAAPLVLTAQVTQTPEATCRPAFIEALTYPAPGGITSISAADVDGDGRPDLDVTTNNYSAGISVRLSQPDGTFGPAITKATNQFSNYGTSGQFTSDSVPDVVIAGNALYFYKGHADGTFDDGVDIGDDFWTAVAGGDVDGDGKRDLVGIDYFSRNLEVVRGNGDGTFEAAITTDAKQDLYDFAVGDLNDDGWDDVVAQWSGNTVLVFLSLGDGHFAPPAEVVAGVSPAAITLADVTGSSALDMIVVTNGQIGILIGNGDGTFQAAVQYATSSSPTRAVPGDFDGDGLVDLAVLDSSHGLVSFLIQSPAGVFVQGRSYVTDSNSYIGVGADFGGDGRLDLVTDGVDQTAEVVLLRALGGGAFQGVPSTVTPGIVAWGHGDFNGDGLPDVAVVSYYEGLSVFVARGDGSFNRTATYPVANQVSALAAADFDEDGNLDLALLYFNNSVFSVMRGNGDGTFQPPTDTLIPTTPSVFNGIVAGDFFGNGHQGVALSDVQAFNSTGELVVYPGLGDATFGSPTVIVVPDAPYQLLTADLDGAGGPDLAYFGQGNNNAFAIEVVLNAGAGTFAQPVAYPTPTFVQGIAAAELHGNGHFDLLLGSPNDSTLKVLPSNGNGTFGAIVSFGLGWQSGSIATADFNGDGNVDVITANTYNATVLFGLGNGAFQSPVPYEAGLGPFLVQAGDYDGDGLADALFASNQYSTGSLTVLKNGGLGARAADRSFLVGAAAQLTVSASGFGPLTYQWRRGGVPLSDGGAISGSQTATLTIDPVSFPDLGIYDVVVSDSCGPVTSNPAYLSVEFADVAVSSPFHADIQAIAAAQITSGCGGANYCPTSPVRRDQMAVFLLKSEHGSDYLPPACTGVFADVPCPSSFADWVEQLAAEGVTGGCGGGNYCPGADVTRAQMAIFLLKTSQGSSYTPPLATGLFGDVPVGSFGADFIEDLYNRGITGGCQASPLLYCPNNTVLRQQMATFLVRTFLGP